MHLGQAWFLASAFFALECRNQIFESLTAQDFHYPADGYISANSQILQYTELRVQDGQLFHRAWQVFLL
jgi:hypothetical protein